MNKIPENQNKTSPTRAEGQRHDGQPKQAPKSDERAETTAQKAKPQDDDRATTA